MRFGQFEIYMLTDGIIGLDGGSMFGIVPKTIWEVTNPPDHRNRIRINLGVLLIKAGGKNILVDTGVGGKLSPKWQDIYAVDRRPSLEDSLKNHRLAPADIDMVINTHLHFDHAGGNTLRDQGGQIVPAFSSARYFIQKGEWEWARTPHERTRFAYMKDDFSPLENSSRLTLMNGDTEILNGVRTLLTPGHTEYHQSILVESEGRTALFMGDLVPMVSHLPYLHIMGYDLFPLKTLETKKRILKQAYEEKWLLIFQHDPNIRMGYLKQADDTFTLEEVRETAP